jgi:phage antirepressor YoqD-like protein
MKADIQIFKNSQFGEVRVTEVNGELYFVAKDVAEKLGYKWNGTDCIKHVPEEWRGVSSVLTPSGVQEVITLSEQGLYFFLARSDKPAALPFQKWIAGEVIPSIRRTGGYMAVKVDETPEEIMARALLVAQETINRQKQRAEIAESKAAFMESVADELHKSNEEMKPKALFADAVATSDKSILIAELSKIITQNGVEIGQNRLFEWLRQNGYLCSKGEYYNLPTQKAMELGLFEIKKTSITKPDGSVLVTRTTKVSGKGQIYFVNKFLRKEAA